MQPLVKQGYFPPVSCMEMTTDRQENKEKRGSGFQPDSVPKTPSFCQKVQFFLFPALEKVLTACYSMLYAVCPS